MWAMGMISDLRRGEAGKILDLVIVAMTVAGLIMSSSLGMIGASHRSTVMGEEEMQRFYAADTGIEDALNRIGNLSSPLPDILEDPLNGNTTNMAVNEYNVSYTILREPGAYRITSTASYPPNLSGPDTVVEATVSLCTLEILPTTGGVTTPDTGSYVYLENTVVSLQAVANEGYNWANWTGNGTVAMDNPNAETTTIRMDADYTIKANFTPEVNNYWLFIQIAPPAGGVTTPSAGNHTYEANTVVPLVAQAKPGYAFEIWSGDVDTVANRNAASTTITMYDNYMVTANFYKIHKLTILAASTGTTTPAPGQYWYREGTVVTLLADAYPRL